MEGQRKRLAVLLVVAAALLRRPHAATRALGKDRAAAGTLNIYGYGPGDDVQENRATYAASQLSGHDVNRPAGDFNDQVFLTRLASGDVPDLVRMGRPRVALYAAKGVLQPMDSCVAAVKKQYRVGAMNAMTYGGHVYGLPEFTNQITLIVNQSAFKDSGVPLSAAQTKNLKPLLATAKKLTKFDYERQPDAHRVRPEDPGVLPALGQVVRRRHHLQERPEGPAEHAACDAALTYAVLDHQRGGRLEQVQVLPRHVRLLRRAEPARQGPARVLADGELHLQRVLEQLAERRPAGEVLHEPQGRPDHVLQR